MTAWEVLAELLRFIGVSLMALITASTLRIVITMAGPEGERLVREARERKENTNV